MSFTSGPFNYNRFDIYEGKAKPDYLDFDKDGDKKEPMKKALKEKGKKNIEEKKELPDFIKKKMDEKKGVSAPSVVRTPVSVIRRKSKKRIWQVLPPSRTPRFLPATPVKYDKKMNLMGPTIKKEDVEQVDENRFMLMAVRTLMQVPSMLNPPRVATRKAFTPSRVRTASHFSTKKRPNLRSPRKMSSPL